MQAFQKHAQKVMASSEFKAVAQKAQPFMKAIRDFSLGQEVSMENMVRPPSLSRTPRAC